MDVRWCLLRAALTVVKTVVSPVPAKPSAGGPTVVSCRWPTSRAQEAAVASPMRRDRHDVLPLPPDIPTPIGACQPHCA